MNYARISMHIALTAIFFIFFGNVNIDRFNNDGVSITKFEETVIDVPPPGNSNFSREIKRFLYLEIVAMYTSYQEHLCDGMDNLQGFKNCIDGKLNSFVETDKPAEITPIINLDSICWKVYPSLGSIGFNETTSMKLLFEKNTEYYLFIHSKNFAFPTANPSVAPKTFIKIHRTESAQNIIIFLKVIYVLVCDLVSFQIL